MKILSIDTSCDETAAAVTEDTKILSNIVWSQASAHAKFGGVMPSLAQRMHEERIDFVIHKALGIKHKALKGIDAIAVTVGPGLSIALGVGVNKAKELAKKYNKPLIPINHVESHLLSPLAQGRIMNNDLGIKHKSKIINHKSIFPAYGLVVSGGNTMFVLIKKIGDYEILAESQDDALGEALDKGARMLGLGYPGGAILEKMARLGNPNKFVLPIPLVGQEKRQIFSYSGLKTSMYRLIETNKNKDNNFPTKQDVYDLSASFQDAAFKHIERILKFYLIHNSSFMIHDLFLGGGVAANAELKKILRRLGAKFGLTLHIPYTKKLCGDNAAMIGVCAYLKIKNQKSKVKNYINYDKVDRDPRLKLTK
jgi:N6-L-threonylcarbamoyladenine synthase